MVSTEIPTSVSQMNREGAGRGAEIQARRLRLGWDKKHLAARAGISRDTLDRVEEDDPGVRPSTFAKVERALDELAEELGFDEAERGGRLLRVEVQSTIPGARAIIVTGPIEDRGEVEAAVANILRQIAESTPTDEIGS